MSGDFADDMYLTADETDALQTAYGLLLGRAGKGSLAESSPPAQPEEQPEPTWDGANLELRAAA